MNRKFTDEEKAIAVQRFLELKAAGKTIPEIEKELGIANSNLYNWTERAKRQSKLTVKKPAPNRHVPQEIKDKALAMLDAGKRITDVAREVKVHAQTIHYWKNARAKANGELLPAPKPAKGLAIGSGGDLTDALIYLRHAEREIMQMVKEEKIERPDQAHLLTLLALGSLQRSINKG